MSRLDDVLPMTVLALAACVTGTPTSEVAQPAAAEPADGPSATSPWWVGYRWTNAEIPYVIDVDGLWTKGDVFPCRVKNKVGPVTDLQLQAIEQAVAEYNALSPVKLIPHDANDPPQAGRSYLLFFHDLEGSSSAAEIRGMPAGGAVNCLHMQSYDDPDDADPVGHAMRGIKHELGHVMGFAHEQQRSDRDQFVEFATCETSQSGSDSKTMSLEPGPLLTPYDYGSIMQYASNNGCDTRCSPCMLKPAAECGGLDPNFESAEEGDCAWIDTTFELSVHDVNALYRMYEPRLGRDEPGDEYGSAYAVGDFDGDGYMDLAIGAPGDDPRGAVYLLKGTAGSKPGSRGRLVNWMKLRPPHGDLTRRRFGASLAAGDFDGDHRMDLAVGAPGPANAEGDGAVYVFQQFEPTNSPRRTLRYWMGLSQDTVGLGSGSPGDHFGAALAAGDFDGDGTQDLVIGVPDKLVGSHRTGEVLIALSSGAFVSGSRQVVPIEPGDVTGASALDGAHFGSALLARSLNPEAPYSGVLRADLAVGSPEDNGTGAVYLYNTRSDASLVRKQILRPSSTSSPTAGMRFGAALAAGNFSASVPPPGHSRVDLAVGAPFADVSAAEVGGSPTKGAGLVYFFTAPDASVVSFSEARTAREPGTGSRHHFGRALGTWSDDRGDRADFLMVGAPDGGGAGSVSLVGDVFGTGDPSGVVRLEPPPGLEAGDRFGAAVSAGDFLPDASEAPGLPDIIVGAPGRFGASGVTFSDNGDTAVWTDYRQALARPE